MSIYSEKITPESCRNLLVMIILITQFKNAHSKHIKALVWTLLTCEFKICSYDIKHYYVYLAIEIRKKTVNYVTTDIPSQFLNFEEVMQLTLRVVVYDKICNTVEPLQDGHYCGSNSCYLCIKRCSKFMGF